MIIITLLAISTVFNILIIGAIIWGGVKYENSGITAKQGLITALIGLCGLIIQLFISAHHLVLITI